MNSKHWLLPLLIFGAFLLMGVWMGRMLGHAFEADHLAATGGKLPDLVDLRSAQDTGEHSNAPLPAEALARVINPNQEPRALKQQRNVLLIGVDELGISPSLESVWLILYIPDLPQITWMPVYPQVLRSQDGVHIEAKAKLRTAFDISGRGTPSKDFMKALEGEGIWWDHYIVVDQQAVIELIDSLGGIDSINPGKSPGPRRSSGSAAISDLRSTSGNLQEALISQASLIQQLCRIPPESYLDPDRVVSIYQNLRENLKTDLSAHQIVEGLQSTVSSGGRIVCDFPALLMLSSSQ